MSPLPVQPAPSEELSNISQLLHLTHHRNKNQHRLAKWWKSFSQLRRQVGNVVREIEALERCLKFSSSASAPISSQAGKKKKGKGTGKGEIEIEKGESGSGREGESKYVKAARETVEERVEFMEMRVLPKCFVAFSNVVADNQYAALGLMLMGTLARVRSIVREFGKEVEDEGESGSLDPLAKVTEDEGKGISNGDRATDVPETDLGEVVSREEAREIENAEGGNSVRIKKSKKSKRIEKEDGDEDTAAGVGEGEKPARRPKKKQKKKGDAFDDMFAGLI